MTRKRRRVKKSVWVALAIIIIVILGITLTVKYIKRINSTDYKLKSLGYNKDDITEIVKLDKDRVKEILNREYIEDLSSYLKEKYFIYDNLDRYLEYKSKHKKTSTKDIITMVNVNRDRDFYTKPEKTDTDKGNLMLVNKYNALDKEFKFEDLTDVSNQHCYGEQVITEEAYDQFKRMFKDAKDEDLTIIINSSYRDYEYQEKLWNRYADNHGEDWADSYAARAGHSEHQTGLAIDVTTYGVKQQEDFEETDEYAWLVKNAHKYGYILRYPKGKEDITGYAYESWHYRYVGVNVATEIYEKDITFDEYYAYYLK